jgi:competence protein ComEC
VLRIRFGSFTALLTGDAEAEATGVEPGAVDLLKVAHHGSADEALPALLSQAVPELAVISVGADNPYGHPAASTMADLDAAEVPAIRTDLAGEVVVEVSGDGWSVE